MCPPKNLHLVTLCSCRLLLSTIHKLNSGSHLWNTCNKAQRKSGQYQSLHQVYEFRHPDPAYPITCNILAAFRGVNLTMNRIQQKDKQIQSEHGMELWKYLPEFCLLRFKKNLKLQVQPAGKYYLVAAILINCRTCLYRSKRSSCFELEPPTLTTYMSNR